jgi:integrase
MEPERPLPTLAILTEDTFAAVVRMFMSPANQKWHLPHDKGGYADETKRGWRRALEFAARPDCLGALSRYEIHPNLVQIFFDQFADRPGKQRSILGALRQLEKWTVKRRYLSNSITLGIEITKPDDDSGHTPWTDEQVAYGETHARPDLAKVITLGGNTGQRGSDLVRMGPTDIETYKGYQGINVIQEKTGRVIWIPILPPLARAMATWPRVPGPFLRRPDGLPMTRKWLTNKWAEERDEAPELRPLRDAGLVIHGLRGHACVRLFRKGYNTKQISEMVGMSEDMVKTYTRNSEQRDNALSAVIQFEGTGAERKSKGFDIVGR